uniref:uncharacterized protein LOC122588719 isoform X1 n=1 Tax=Erigeron canadensis TaxID=72917 RepID=UPI001CB94B77|nr:uncharacterized protein LOC122588719 isoform X1 [Erigeron canadensis]
MSSSSVKAFAHLEIPLAEIVEATNNFADKNWINHNEPGKTYKGQLLVGGELITIDAWMLDRWNGVPDMFWKELTLLSRLKHENIVSNIGYCQEEGEYIIINKHEFNGSLDKHLRDTTWIQRLKISVGIARALSYIHYDEGHDLSIIHRNIKCATIFLDENWVPKLSSFGNFMNIPVAERHRAHNSVVYGSLGYIDPVYKETGMVSHKSDVYSLGMVLFEILSGRLAWGHYIDFKRAKLDDFIDPDLRAQIMDQQALSLFYETAYSCLNEDPSQRPNAHRIVRLLKKALELQQEHEKPPLIPKVPSIAAVEVEDASYRSLEEPEKDKEDTLRIPLDKILIATQNFSMKIGKGGFGVIYKGEVSHANEHKTIAAKRLNKDDYYHGKIKFAAECIFLSKYKHENVVGIVGYCKEESEMVIVYEYASNLSLDRHLGNNDLTWLKRLNICIDIARGIHFLHEGLGTSEILIHRNIKSGSILLDDDWKAKISNFDSSLTIPKNQQMDYVNDEVVGTKGYIDPVYQRTTFLTKESDIYSLGVVLLEVLCGKLSIAYDVEREHRFLCKLANRHFSEKGTLEEIVLNCIKEQIVPQSLAIYSRIALQCLDPERENRPTAIEVIVQLTHALEFQVNHEMWEPRLPKDYQSIIQLSMSPESYSTIKKEDLYNIFSNGILLQHEKVLSFRGNGERNEMISARNFSYVHSCPHKWRSVPESRFEKVPEMLDVSNLMIEIMTRPQFLTPNTVYGVHLVFKYCESSTFSAIPAYVNLKYRNKSETLHAYFATWRDDNWMMIELCRFMYHIEDDISFKFLLESFSPSYFNDCAIYVEGIEFRAIHKVKHKNTEKPEQVQQSRTNNNEEILNGYINCEDCEKLFWASEVNGKKQLLLSAKAVLYDTSDVKLLTSKAAADSRWLTKVPVLRRNVYRTCKFPEVIKLLPQQIFHINCRIESHMLSQETEYVCYLVFKISEKSHGMQGPVKVRDLLNPGNKEPEFIYFISPSPWNIHDITRVPEQRDDGWMEVNVGRFNSTRDLHGDCALLNLKFTSYEGIMSGLILCGLEFRPV